MTRLEKILETPVDPKHNISRRLAWFIAQILVTRDATKIHELVKELGAKKLRELAEGCQEFLSEAKHLHREKLCWDESQLKEWVSQTHPENRAIQSAFRMFALLKQRDYPGDETLLDELVKRKDLYEVFYLTLESKLLEGMYMRYVFPPETVAYLHGPCSPIFSETQDYEGLPTGLRQLRDCELVQISTLEDPNHPEFHFAITFTGRGLSIHELIAQHPTPASWFAPLFNDE